MGNCCGGDHDTPISNNQGVDRKQGKQYTFQGEGYRLGTIHETRTNASLSSGIEPDDTIPEPIINPTLSDAQRETIRADRAAAAEARMKKQGLNSKQKKKPPTTDTPLRGPNSEPLMRWNAAG